MHFANKTGKGDLDLPSEDLLDVVLFDYPESPVVEDQVDRVSRFQ